MSMITVAPSTSLDELLALARRIRAERYGTRITYSPKVFIPLTMLCSDHCGYCTFAKPPAKLASAYLDPDQVLEIARAGAAAGCHEALFTLGERPEERYPRARHALDAMGYRSTVDYLAEACRLVVAETGLLPHANAGALSPRPRSGGHRPELPPQAGHSHGRRVAAPHGGVPLDDRRRPRPARPEHPPPGAAEPHRRLRRPAGGRHRRLGRRQPGHRRSRQPRAPVARAGAAAPGDRGRGLRARAAPDGLPGDGRRAGDLEPPPTVIQEVPAAGIGLTGASAGGRVGEVLAGVLDGQEPGEDELVALFAARGPEVRAVAEVADDLRRRTSGEVVTFVRNRNINYTNVCTFCCKFCAFSKGLNSLNLRGAPYLLGLDEVAGRVVDAHARGATEVTLQGGIHPSFDGDYYIHVARAVKEAVPEMHVHGFTALEVHEGARRLQEPLRDYLLRLKDAGLASLPGTAAEILD